MGSSLCEQSLEEAEKLFGRREPVDEPSKWTRDKFPYNKEKYLPKDHPSKWTKDKYPYDEEEDFPETRIVDANIVLVPQWSVLSTVQRKILNNMNQKKGKTYKELSEETNIRKFQVLSNLYFLFHHGLVDRKGKFGEYKWSKIKGIEY